MIVESAFKPAWWLANPHAQTMYATLLRKISLPYMRFERLELSDGDFIDLAWIDGGLSVEAPLVILLHGLGGNYRSQYIQAQIVRYKRMGWRAVVVHLRGASDEPNRMLRAYHLGDTADFNFFLHRLHEREPHTRKMGVGFSLGGSVLLKWLGEHSTQQILSAAVAVSVPFQPGLGADRLNQGFSRIYQNYLLKRLHQHFLRKMQDKPDAQFLQTLQTCRCFWTFDDRITAPLNGFENVHEYYRVASAKAYLCKIATPTLIIHALDDPFMTPEAVPNPEELAPSVTLELSQQGGHVGFVGSTKWGRPKYWLDDRITEFFNES